MTPEEAIDAMFAEVASATPTDVTIIWEDVPANKPPDSLWIRPTIKHASGAQSTLSSHIGSKRQTMIGFLIIQCFTPVGAGALRAVRLATAYVSHFAAYKGAVWFRNEHFKEIGKDGPSLQYNVVIEFEYDVTIERA
jgi:hypothetical protein